jgi:hypothetical protein
MSLPSYRHRTRRHGASLAALAACAVGVSIVAVGLPSGGDDPSEGAAVGAPTRPAAAEPRSEPGADERGAAAAPRGAAREAGSAARASTRVAGRAWPEVDWRDSAALGVPTAGELARGVRLPPEGRHFFTWDPVERTSPNRPWRRWGTDHAIRGTLRVLADSRRAAPRAPRLGIGDLSRPHGGDFGTAYGPIGHSSHQNGLDVDVYYPLKDGRERAPLSVDEIDLGLSQDLVDRFVAAGADRVFVGPSTGLTGPPDVVQAIPNHDNHLHVRFPADG